jgi:hypothetical protein
MHALPRSARAKAPLTPPYKRAGTMTSRPLSGTALSPSLKRSVDAAKRCQRPKEGDSPGSAADGLPFAAEIA